MRTLLTVLGISIGITTVVALGAITAGLKGTMGELVNAGGTDFMVAQGGASNLSFSEAGTTHDPAVATRADRIVRMLGGRALPAVSLDAA